MPTPVSAARQCLTEEAARALDEAVAVARRRSHAQTTSLHAVSALLALPSSTLRDACARARGSGYPSRLQFRALELCVGVSLDRLPSSKTLEDPPISNSLMAAIKRSQANQRRHPESYHLQQLHINSTNNNNSGNQTTSLLKVELKYFILSILDDPIVSRVFGEAGFRSCDIKLALLHPPVTQLAQRFPRSRCPPIFLCTLTDSDPCLAPGRSGFTFPFSGQEDNIDENCRRIGEVLVKKSGKNPLLVGVCAGDALRNFTESVQRGKAGFLPADVSGLTVFSIEKHVSEFVVGGGEEQIASKFKELEHVLEHCSAGVVLNFGDLKNLIGDGSSADAVSYVVSKLMSLLGIHRGKLWLIGAAASYEMYSKFLARFPSIEKDWDLHLLPITSSRSSFEGVYPKSSLMGSFVPFGGFFSTSSDFKNPISSINQSIPRCHLCSEKYEQEVAAVLKAGSTVSVADHHSEKLPSWLWMASLDTSKELDMAKTKDDGAMLNAKVLGLQKKWNDFCQRLHHSQPFPKLESPLSRSQGSIADHFQFAPDKKRSGSEDLFIDDSHFASLSPGMQMNSQKIFPPKHNMTIPLVSEAENVNFQSRVLVEIPKTQPIDKAGPWFTHQPQPNLKPTPEHTSLLTASIVATDLKLGAPFASTSQEPNTPKLQDHKERFQHVSGSISAEFDVNSDNTSHQFAQSSSCSGLTSGEQYDLRDYKSIRKVLSEKVSWQNEAIRVLSEAISRCRTGYRRHRGSNSQGDIWLTFLGPDRVGKRRIASSLAEILFGSQENFICVDLSSQDKFNQSNSIFGCLELNGYDVKFRGKTVTDYIAGELIKKPHSVVFLENVDKADFLVQSSLSQGIRTGKFPDSHGREISINNMVFITTSNIGKYNVNVLWEKKPDKFSEERILGARSQQMQLLFGCLSEDSGRGNGMNLRVTRSKETMNSASFNKRKLIDASGCREQEEADTPKRAHKTLRSCLDLNLPVEETTEDANSGDYDSDSISENSEAWLEEFFDQVDEKIVFKPFDFDMLAEEILKEVDLLFQRTFGSEVVLEINQEVMVQILAAAWLSDGKRSVKDWLENVLSKSFAEARQKYNLTSQSVVKLVSCEDTFVKEQTPGVCLPAKINLK